MQFCSLIFKHLKSDKIDLTYTLNTWKTKKSIFNPKFTISRPFLTHPSSFVYRILINIPALNFFCAQALFLGNKAFSFCQGAIQSADIAAARRRKKWLAAAAAFNFFG